MVGFFEEKLRDALNNNDFTTLASTLIDLEQEIHQLITKPDLSNDVDKLRGILRQFIVELATVASKGIYDISLPITPFIELLITIRNLLRNQKLYAIADLVRIELGKLNIELRDAEEETQWYFKS